MTLTAALELEPIDDRAWKPEGLRLRKHGKRIVGCDFCLKLRTCRSRRARAGIFLWFSGSRHLLAQMIKAIWAGIITISTVALNSRSLQYTPYVRSWHFCDIAIYRSKNRTQAVSTFFQRDVRVLHIEQSCHFMSSRPSGPIGATHLSGDDAPKALPGPGGQPPPPRTDLPVLGPLEV